MTVAIIVFSPTGNTLKVVGMLEKKLEEKGVQVQLVDVTRNGKLFCEKRYEDFLNDNVKEHDVLLVGAPVYAHHMHYIMIEIVKSLPRPDKKDGVDWPLPLSHMAGYPPGSPCMNLQDF